MANQYVGQITPSVRQAISDNVGTLIVFDRRYREQGKPAIWFLPLSEPIAPHLDELLGLIPVVK